MGSKAFFFGKKKQKTFFWLSRGLTQADLGTADWFTSAAE